MTSQHSAKKSSKNTPKNNRTFKGFLLKFSFTALVLTIFYGGYLDWQIRSKMDGQIWHLPAEVYSRLESVKIADNLAFDEVIQILLDNEYRQTTMVAAPGDFKLEDDSIVVLRRAFPFPDKAEPQRVLRLRFSHNKLSRIEDLVTVKTVDEFRLAPKLIAMLQSDNEDRLAIPLQNYPRLLIDTLILTEDRRFYEHNGINPVGILRALIANIRAGQTVQGGSTLTQQLVKNLFLSRERTITRKANEALMSLVLDWRYDKNRILETYLNEIYLGQNGDTQIHGFELASQFYFGRSIREISLDQIALLVGMVKGPSLYNPWRNPQNALERRNIVLRLMLEHKMIGDELYQLLSQRPLGVQKKGQISRKYPAFIQTLQADLRRELGEHKISSLLGARIFSTMDLKQQAQAENAVVNTVSQLQLKMKNPHLEGAMIITDYRTGEIRAVVGGLQTQYAGFNRALMAKRQIGSLVKPSIYLTALSNPEQFRLNTPINNQPITINVKGSPPWQPRNYDKKYSDSVMLMDALARSLNIPTVNIGMKVGLSKVIDTQKAMGWDNVEIPKVPAMLLGSYTISPYDVTKLYQTLANQGGRIALTTVDSIADRQGNLIFQHDKSAKQVVPQEAAFQTLFAMQQTVERGTARSLQKDYADLHLAGKTGTTNESRDTWFVGIDGKNISTVWLGRDDNGETKLTGASGALQIYKDYLNRTNIEKLTITPPTTVKWVGINQYGDWDCESYRTIPIWLNNGQNFCGETSFPSLTPTTETETPPQESLWDVLDNPNPPAQ
ncbi:MULTISPECIES: penicillin-binding protein 1B [Haemophilus]|uniref:Penicillin-binding protein 1B n=2 Tax=Haemophilus TaxID=724 RepID=A0AAV2U2W8_HAEIF|nr:MULTISPECIES: penicillin-binding protein 1B [Haemophilus]EGF16964.1 penicillin-binding protein 1B [Haemophilus aegyptius ATCC 11116]OBX84195.1 penicillin-binding protein 1B [Haemophilus aegyptius]QEQ58756.1 penicillin-binding protein 1B [Haemophilus influenzae biotype aegyptius]TMQ45846.1 penicillin-binding protein 1B [Haemophilus influenzae biotype aegyptius]UAK82282.1 penicillin-binding protein 1B [Haemophilus aegyptius]